MMSSQKSLYLQVRVEYCQLVHVDPTIHLVIVEKALNIMVSNQTRPNDLKAIATFLVKVAILGTCITLATNIILFSCISKKAYDIHVAMDW